MNRLFLFFILFFTILSANSVHCSPPDSFEITIKRDILNHNTLEGRIFVNGKAIGKTWERFDLRIEPGQYPGNIRYFSENENAVGPFGEMGFIGDFLLEIEEVTWSDGKKRTNLLFHGGNNWKHSSPSFRIKKINPIITISYFFKIFIMALHLLFFIITY